MGFFSDLKEDLSQAVNELVPEEEMKVAAASTIVEPDLKVEVNNISADLSQMLEDVAGETKPVETKEEFYIAPTVETKKKEVNAYQPVKKHADETSIITESMILNGNLATEGSLEMKGNIVGNIEVLGKLNITGTIQGNSQAAEIYAENAKITGELRSNGSIKIGQSSVIIGNIFGTSAVVAGAIKGDIDIQGPVILDASAIVMGNIKSKSVQINNGAVIEGMCSQCYAEVNPTSFFEEIKKMK